MKFNVVIEVEASPLVATDTVDYELGRLASAFSLFASEYRITLSGAAEGKWHGVSAVSPAASEDEW